MKTSGSIHSWSADSSLDMKTPFARNSDEQPHHEAFAHDYIHTLYSRQIQFFALLSSTFHTTSINVYCFGNTPIYFSPLNINMSIIEKLSLVLLFILYIVHLKERFFQSFLFKEMLIIYSIPRLHYNMYRIQISV